jgi:Putative beta-barrel porin-2, OmpL-like. bbp2
MDLTIQIVFMTLIASSKFALAADTYTNKRACGTAQVLSGDTCANAKVEFNLKECGFSESIPAKVTCEGKAVKAQYVIQDKKFQARFNKHEGWGSSPGWAQNGQVQQLEKMVNSLAIVQKSEENISEKVEETKLPALNSPAIVSEVVPSLKFSAFFDFRYSTYQASENPGVVNTHAESGFALEDGAFYLNYSKNRLSALVDIPFRRSKETDLTPASPAQSQNNNFAIGYDRAQAYLKYKMSEDLFFSFGQFDTIFGVELNDSKDRFFGKTGLVYDALIPVTHAGAMLEYVKNGFTARAFGANPNNKGSYGTSAGRDENTEYGASFSFSNETYRGQIAGMSRSLLKASGDSFENRVLVDVLFGTTLGNFSIDLEFTSLSDPGKNSLTPVDNTDLENSGTGTLLLATYKLNDQLTVGGRYEMLNEDPTGSSFSTVNAETAGIHYRISPDFEIRSEYMMYHFKNTADVKWNDSRFNVAAVVQL